MYIAKKLVIGVEAQLKLGSRILITLMLSVMNRVYLFKGLYYDLNNRVFTARYVKIMSKKAEQFGRHVLLVHFSDFFVSVRALVGITHADRRSHQINTRIHEIHSRHIEDIPGIHEKHPKDTWKGIPPGLHERHPKDT